MTAKSSLDSLSKIHRRGTEFAEIGKFFNQELLTPRSRRLRGGMFEFGTRNPTPETSSASPA